MGIKLSGEIITLSSHERITFDTQIFSIFFPFSLHANLFKAKEKNC
jgi:hypothetical protein